MIKNHLPQKFKLIKNYLINNLTKINQLLADCYSSSKMDCEPTIRHLHVWHVWHVNM